MEEEKLLSELDDEELARNRQTAFNEDALWREQCLGGDGSYYDHERLYESIGEVSNEGGFPEINRIREPVDDAISLAILNAPKSKLEASEVIDPNLPRPLRKIRELAIERSAIANDRHISTLMSRDGFEMLREAAITQAGIFGVGYTGIWIDDAVDTRKNYHARRLAATPMSQWTDEDRRIYDQIEKTPRSWQPDVRNVFWMRGVRDAFSDEMLRVHYLELKDLGALKRAYPELSDKIRPGIPPYYVRTTPHTNETTRQVGVLTTWELEPVPKIHQRVDVLEDGTERVIEQRPFSDYQMVMTKLAGDVLLEKKVWTSDEGPLCLPIIPWYIFKSQKHPYGYPLTLALKLVQNFINSLYAGTFEQVRQSVSPQAIAIMLGKLGASDTIEEIEEKLISGGVVPFEGNETDDIREAIMPLSHLSSGVNPAIATMIQMAEQQLQRVGQGIDRAAIRSKDSGVGVRSAIAAADRNKAPMTGLISKSQKVHHERLYEFHRYCYRDRMPVAVRRNDGSYETIVLNDPRRVQVPIPDPNNPAQQARNPYFAGPGNPEGRAFFPYEFKDNDTQIDMMARTEGEGMLPIDWQARLVALSALVQDGTIHPLTKRELALPDEIAVIDDEHRRQEAERQRAEQEAEAMRNARIQMALMMGSNLMRPDGTRAGSPPNVRPRGVNPNAMGTTAATRATGAPGLATMSAPNLVDRLALPGETVPQS